MSGGPATVRRTRRAVAAGSGLNDAEAHIVHGYHVIFGTYWFWLPNDPRGSWSNFVASWELARFGAATKVLERLDVDLALWGYTSTTKKPSLGRSDTSKTIRSRKASLRRNG